jgi:pyruvate-formate lyase-activating enzyme
MSSSYCVMPFNSLEISPNGTCLVCCKIGRPIQRPDGRPFNLLENSIEEVWNSEDLQSLRQRFIKGDRPKECQLCWTEEDAGTYSLRQQSNAMLKDRRDSPTVEYLVLKLSNLCNLKCRICNPEWSTSWAAEENQFHTPSAEVTLDLKARTAPKLRDENMRAIRQWMPSLRRVLIYGGEPFLNKEAYSLLNELIDKGHASHVAVTLNSNGSVYDEKWVEALRKFERVDLFLSIDDVGPRFEYQRKGAKWEYVARNFERFMQVAQSTPHFKVGVFASISLFNVLTIRDLLEWTLNFPEARVELYNLIHQPREFSIRNLPPAIKATAEESLQSLELSRYNVGFDASQNAILGFLNLPPDPGFESPARGLEKIVHKLDDVDQRRSESFCTTFPEMFRELVKAGAYPRFQASPK